MKTAERRNAILKLLQNAEEPVAARKLAERYGVSRQVIVQDMAGLHTGDHFNDQGLCDGAGTALCKRI